jgi:hypothetical protein
VLNHGQAQVACEPSNKKLNKVWGHEIRYSHLDNTGDKRQSSEACGIADRRRGSALSASLLKKVLENPPTRVSALNKAAFGGFVAQIGGIAEKFCGFYPRLHLADSDKKPADLGKLLSEFESKLDKF